MSTEGIVDARRIVARCNAVFSRPPAAVPNWHSADGPLLGNGDMAVCMGMSPVPGQHRFWLSKNDFWRLSGTFIRGEKRCSPKTFGTLNVTLPALAGSPYRVIQQLLDAQTVAVLAGDDTVLTMRAWVAATRNLLVVEFSAVGRPVEVETELWVKPESEKGRECTFVNPWPGKAVDVYRDGKKTLTLSGERIAMRTKAGDTVVLTAAGAGCPESAIGLVP